MFLEFPAWFVRTGRAGPDEESRTQRGSRSRSAGRPWAGEAAKGGRWALSVSLVCLDWVVDFSVNKQVINISAFPGDGAAAVTKAVLAACSQWLCARKTMFTNTVS